MRNVIAIVAISLFVVITGAPPALSQNQEIEGYTFMRAPTGGTLVCLGRWVPNRDPVLPGVCEGDVVDVAQLTAVSAKLSADRLDQLLFVLGSIDQRLALNNDLVTQLIQFTANTQMSVDQQTRQVGELLHGVIELRFQALPAEVLSNDLFREEVQRLKEDILKEVDKRYSSRPAPAAK